jgi:hypothetical protein
VDKPDESAAWHGMAWHHMHSIQLIEMQTVVGPGSCPSWGKTAMFNVCSHAFAARTHLSAGHHGSERVLLRAAPIAFCTPFSGDGRTFSIGIATVVIAAIIVMNVATGAAF